MNIKKLQKIAEKNTPEIQANIKPGTHRHNVADSLQGVNNIGIELGVAQGVFSKKMIETKKFSHFYGVDMYSDTIHTTEEYKLALQKVGLLENYKLLRMTFNDALDLFEDNFFDFIYIDGFAHTGEEGGETLSKWYKKLKVGGVFSGDDYHSDWPLVMWAVNNFAKQTACSLSITDKIGDTPYCQYPSWFIKKEEYNEDFIIPELLKNLASNEKGRIKRRRIWSSKIRQLLRINTIKLKIKKILKK
jgi:hypothetical protein